jgi:hypothetical protein
MAQGLTARGTLLLIALGVSGGGQGAHAQALFDPTRPPQFGSAEPAAAAPRSSVTRLQSVLIARNRSIAIIDGRRLQVGDRLGDATLVSIEPGHVTLQRGAKRERLSLLSPGIDKRPVK